jgi:hypothetical protein
MQVHHSVTPLQKPWEDIERKTLIEDKEQMHADNDQTALTRSLNNMLATSSQGVYKGGHGVVVRNLDDGAKFRNATSGIVNGVVPATLMSNDIMAHTTMFTGVSTCVDDAYAFPSVGVVIGSKLSTLWVDGDKIQEDGWDNGVFYGNDANSADHRCRWVDQDKGYDCPGGWVPQGGEFQANPSFLGSGTYPSGNPLKTSGGGGGAGCHTDHYHNNIDQYDAIGTSLLKNEWCECNTALNGNNWQDWVHQWILHGKAKPHSRLPAIGGGWNKSLVPQWGVNLAACWVSNPRDMIQISNAMWLLSNEWLEYLPPVYSKFRTALLNSNSSLPSKAVQVEKPYWGWNEIPVDRTTVDDANNWDAIVIKIPAALCGSDGKDDSLDCLSHNAQVSLERNLKWYIEKKYLKLGSSNLMKKPGSSVVLLREYYAGDRSWKRHFFCQSWTSPKKKYNIVFENQVGCFLDLF